MFKQHDAGDVSGLEEVFRSQEFSRGPATPWATRRPRSWVPRTCCSPRSSAGPGQSFGCTTRSDVDGSDAHTKRGRARGGVDWRHRGIGATPCRPILPTAAHRGRCGCRDADAGSVEATEQPVLDVACSARCSSHSSWPVSRRGRVMAPPRRSPPRDTHGAARGGRACPTLARRRRARRSGRESRRRRPGPVPFAGRGIAGTGTARATRQAGTCRCRRGDDTGAPGSPAASSGGSRPGWRAGGAGSPPPARRQQSGRSPLPSRPRSGTR